MSVRIIKGDVREKLAELPADYFDAVVTSPPYYQLRDYKCEGQIGLEPTLDAYLETMVAVCRELRRVLKPSGVFFLVIGDSYATGGRGGGADESKQQTNLGSLLGAKSKPPQGLKPKDLCLVPERLGISLQGDGWWVRSKIIWHKLNPMPESCVDRPTSAHETIWLLTKRPNYFWDGEAVREAYNEGSLSRYKYKFQASTSPGRHQPGNKDKRFEESDNFDPNKSGRSIRNVWSFASHPYPGAHFATFPPELAERCIKAGSSERGCCPACGKPWVRVVETIVNPPSRRGGSNTNKDRNDGGMACNADRTTKTLGWQPSCNCTPIVSQLAHSRILDPFAGAGTTGLVADRLGRDCTLIDLNTEYAEMALNRIKDDAPLLVEVAAE